MRLIKLSSIFAVLGFVFFTLSYFAAKALEQSKTFSFPESIGRHYAKAGGNGGTLSLGGEAVVFKKTIPMDAAHPFESIEIATNAVNVEVAQNKNENEIEIELLSNQVDPNDPVLIDPSNEKVLRIMSQEEKTNGRVGKHGWMMFNFDDSPQPMKKNFLQVRVPKGIKTAQVQTVSGDTLLSATLSTLLVQSKSGDFGITRSNNPLARVEKLTFQTVSGDLRGPGRFDSLKFNSVSGDARPTSLDRVLEIDAATVSGDVKLYATEPLDMKIDFQSTSGDLKIASSILPKGPDGKPIKPKTGSQLKYGKGTVHVKLQSVSGDLRIRPPSKVTAPAADGDDENADHDESEETNSDSDEEARVECSGSHCGEAQKYAEEFLSCAAKIAAREQTRIGASAARRCFRIIV